VPLSFHRNLSSRRLSILRNSLLYSTNSSQYLIHHHRNPIIKVLSIPRVNQTPQLLPLTSLIIMYVSLLI
jgi:hypothetical protein